MPNEIEYLKGGFYNPLNWVIWLFDKIFKLSEHIKNNEILMFTFIIILVLIATTLLFNYFIADKFYKILVTILLTLMGVLGLHYNSKNIFNNTMTFEEEINQNVKNILGDFHNE